MVEKIIPGLKMYPFNTTLMGVLKGVADYFDLAISDAWLFGGSGHAFLINIHEQICPSSPYVWNPETFRVLVRNLGISIKDLGFFHSKSPPDERARVEEVLRSSLDTGTPCSLLNMENQLIAGYDDTHFIVLQPWPKVDLPITPKTLTYQTWKELGDEVHIDFYTYTKIGKADDETIIKESLNYAVDMAQNPDKYSRESYDIGFKAYDTWINAVKDGHGGSHGNWWNGTVWMECREMASKYFTEIVQKRQGKASERATELSIQYKKIAELLDKARDKELADTEKIETLQRAKEVEKSCVDQIEELLDSLSR